MEPTVFYVGLYFLVSLLHLASSRVDSYNGWKNSPNVQYHIQTDEGEERYFKYQTKSGQYRKEKRLQDGTVVGTYGWVDPNGYLRLRDYIADNQGYRILKTKMIYVGGNSVSGDSTPGTFHTKYSPLPSVTFQLPYANQNHRFGNYIPSASNAYASPSSNAYIPPSTNAYVPPSTNAYASPSTNAYVPPSTNAYVPPSTSSYVSPSTNSYVSPSTNAYVPPYFSQSYDSYVTSTPSSAPHISSTPLVSYPSYYPSSTPLVEISPHSAPKSSTPVYPSSTSSPSVAIFSDPTPKPIAAYSTTPKPIAVNYISTPSPTPIASYSSTPSPIEHTTPHAIPAIGIASSTTPPPPLPPVSGKFAYFDRNNNFITETEKNKLFYQYEDKNSDYYNNKQYVDYKNDFEEYDGIAAVQNGFRYYLPRHYHEEQTSSSGQERTGSFGYIDPFGIRRVIYYNTAPGRGFVHRKNNRYVGFNATPYDPRPNF